MPPDQPLPPTLPEAARERVRELTTLVRQKQLRPGVAALLTGPSGPGKTMAAEAIASDLGLTLYQVDSRRILSKYIGETEKNLEQVFEKADASGVVLLFDEADALFGKRSDVKDSHDRYANIEIGYLLERIEAWEGLALLASNRRDAIDAAVLRRLAFVIEFDNA